MPTICPASTTGRRPIPRPAISCLELGHVDGGLDGDDIARHEARHRGVRESVAKRLVDVLARDQPDQGAVVQDRHASVAPARHQLARLAHRRLPARASRTSRAHDVLSPQRRRNLRLERLLARAQRRPDRVASLNARRRRLVVTSPAEPGHRCADVDLGEPTASDHLRPVGHAHDRDRHPIAQVFDDVVREHSGRVDVLIRRGDADGDLLPVDVPHLERGGQLGQERALLGLERPGKELVDDLQVGAAGHEPRGRLRVVRGGARDR